MPSQDSVVIVGAARTPMGAFQGALKDLSAPELGAVAIRAALERAQLAPEQVSEVVGQEVERRRPVADGPGQRGN